MATPAISRMKELRPDWDIHVVASQENCFELFESLPAVSRSHLFRFWSLGYGALVRDLPPLTSQRFDVTLLAYPAVRSQYHLLSFAIAGRRRIAHRDSGTRVPLHALSELVEVEPAHNVINNLNLLKELGLPIDSPPQSYSVPPTWISGRRKDAEIGVHVGSMTYKGNELKRWPLDRYVTLCRELRSQGFEIAFIAGQNEMIETEYVRERVDPGARFISGPLAEVARSISDLSLVVSADNGIAHLAAGVNTPVVVLFGPTDPAKCSPWGRHVAVVRPSDCPPCFEFRDKLFACKRQIGARCIRQDVSVEQVSREVSSCLRAAGIVRDRTPHFT